jgi:hypothetical protein
MRQGAAFHVTAACASAADTTRGPMLAAADAITALVMNDRRLVSGSCVSP